MAQAKSLTVLITAAALGGGVAACGGGSAEVVSHPPVALGICGPVDPAAGVAARDSAGVRIVENLVPEWGPDAGLELGARPVARVRGSGSDALFLSDGRIVVADADAYEVRVYGSTGRLLNRFGQEGDGPGEFSGSLAVHRGPGDTLLVAWASDRRYARVLPDGTFLGGGPVAPEGGDDDAGRALRGVFGNGDLLVAEGWREAGGAGVAVGPDVDGDAAPAPSVPVEADGSRVRRLDPASGALGPVVVVPEADLVAFAHELDGPSGPVESTALGEAELYVGRAGVFQVERHAGTGAVDGLFRFCQEEEPARLEVRTDARGRIWVRDFTLHADGQIWRVLEPGGRWLGSVLVPGDLRVVDIGSDRLLAVGEDERGRSALLVYRIESRASEQGPRLRLAGSGVAAGPGGGVVAARPEAVGSGGRG